jgi:octaprenyl-diphosphate synthase
MKITALMQIPNVSTTLDLQPVISQISAHIEEVNARMRRQAAAFDPALVGYVEYICESPGKRIRAALALLSGAATGGIRTEHVDLGTIIELIHLASLVHDDIMDSAPTRRGRATAHSKWGPEVAVLLGDALFAHALKLCTNYDSTHLARRIAGASTDVCQGEILQTQRQFDLNLTVQEYFKIIRLKTASLFSVASELGAYLSGSPESVCAQLAKYGEHLGVAYQIYDDCLDMIGREDCAGKTLGSDLVKGKITLPVLLHLKNSSGRQHEIACANILHGTEAERLGLICELHNSGAFKEALCTVESELLQAMGQLRSLPDSCYKKSLEALVSALNVTVSHMISELEKKEPIFGTAS